MAVDQATITVDALNALPEPGFLLAIAPFFEGAPAFLGRLAAARPFLDEEELFDRAAAITLDMPETEQLELIDAHPRIGAQPAQVSAMSFMEQGYAEDAAAAQTPAAETQRARLQAELDRLNDAYEARFGFRFVVFVAGRLRAEIVPVIEARLACERESEKRTALVDVIAVARDRWRRRA